IMTIEDPIEFLIRDKRSIVNQREVGVDTLSFAQALKSALRQDPDVILVGEMRDLETIETALTAAETGHLVLSTLHTLDATETITRIISAFPPHQQKQVRLQLGSVLRGVISQRLVPRADFALSVSGISATSDSTWDDFDKKDEQQAQNGKAPSPPGRPSSTTVGRVSPAGAPARPAAPAKAAPAAGSSKDDDDFQIERF